MKKTETVTKVTCDFCKEETPCYDAEVEIGTKAFSKYDSHTVTYDICPRCKSKLTLCLEGSTPLFVYPEESQ
jgi:hypothetical protein